MSKTFQLVMRAVILNADHHILILQRPHNSKNAASRWEFPGGKVDLGEDFVTALIREVKEETNLTIRVERALDVTQGDGATKIFVYLLMLATLISGELRISHEHIAAQWIPVSKLSSVELSDHLRNVGSRISKMVLE